MTAPALTETPAVQVRDLSFTYGDRHVLHHASITVATRDFVSIVGPNGGGKTTLLRLVLGLIEPDAGTVRVFGREPRHARSRVGYMPQHVNLDPQFPVTAGDVVLMGRLRPGHPVGPFRRADRDAARQALESCNGGDLASRPFASLSGGQRQRVLIARALACRPQLLLLDEPTASLDPTIQDDLYDLLHRLNASMAVVLVSHDVATVSRHSNQVICVNVEVAQHPTSAIGPELARLFPGHEGLRAVQHGHGHGHGHEHGLGHELGAGNGHELTRREGRDG
ncbi:MAG: ABC transporter ATP-binding protein [Candidatus Krumholzibacteriia bacterium]